MSVVEVGLALVSAVTGGVAAIVSWHSYRAARSASAEAARVLDLLGEAVDAARTVPEQVFGTDRSAGVRLWDALSALARESLRAFFTDYGPGARVDRALRAAVVDGVRRVRSLVDVLAARPGERLPRSRGVPVRDRLVDRLLAGALLKLPADLRERYAEEWADHRRHKEGWRLVWWALCLRATAARTAREYRLARLPRSGG